MSATPGVLHVIPDLETGGAERLVVELAGAVHDAGGVSLVASQGGAMVDELEARGARHIAFPAATKNPLAIAANAERLKELAAQHRLGIVHVHSRAPAWSGVLARRSGMAAALVTTHHGTYGAKGALKRLYNSGIARGDAVIAHSAFIADLIRSRYPFAVPNLSVIPAGIDLTTFDPGRVTPQAVEAMRRSWGIAPGERVILHAARLTEWKGQRVLVEAAAQLNRPAVAVILAGDAQGRVAYRAELEALIEARGQRGRVHLVGPVTDMAVAYAAADVAAFPSTQAEAFGLAVVEAQAMGVPVVVADHGAPVETVLIEEDQRTGWRVAPRDAAALAVGLQQALDLSQAARAAMAACSIAHCAAHYSLPAMTDAHLALYRRLSVAP